MPGPAKEHDDDAGRLAVPSALRDHPDRLRWNDRYQQVVPTFEPSPLVDRALTAGLPDGPVLEMASGRSGSALALAEAGRRVVALDVSEVALAQLRDAAQQRGLGDRVRCMVADAADADLGSQRFALVLATRFWDPVAFRAGSSLVLPGGLLAWEALLHEPGAGPPSQPWYVVSGELPARLPTAFEVLLAEECCDGQRRIARLLARLARAGQPDTRRDPPPRWAPMA